MLNLDVTPVKMSYDEIKSWLDECAAEIEKAYDEDNITYANKLDTIYQAVKQIGTEKLKEEIKNCYGVGVAPTKKKKFRFRKK